MRTTAESGAGLVSPVAALPGIGKQFGVQPGGWREATGVDGEEGSLGSVADIYDETSLAKVREYKQSMKAGA